MNDIRVKLGGKEYELKPKPIRKAREVRQMIEKPFGTAINALLDAPKKELNDLEGLGSLAISLKDTLLGSMDILLNIVCAYSEEIARDRKQIEEEAFDEEVVKAFVEVIKLLYPFGSLAESVNGFKKPAT
jgi:hypothetical protein